MMHKKKKTKQWLNYDKYSPLIGQLVSLGCFRLGAQRRDQLERGAHRIRGFWEGRGQGKGRKKERKNQA